MFIENQFFDKLQEIFNIDGGDGGSDNINPLIDIFNDEDIRLGFSNLMTSMSFTEVWNGMTNFYNMFSNYNDAGSDFFDILIEKLKGGTGTSGSGNINIGDISIFNDESVILGI
jgi:hypothetical protein